MPTIAEKEDCESDPLNSTLTEHYTSWIEELPICSYSGVSSATNVIYDTDGGCKKLYDFQDRSFHYRIDEDIFLYGVFDGHNGCRAVDFVSQRLLTEILMTQLKEKDDDIEIKHILQRAFLITEDAFFQSKENLELQTGYETDESVHRCDVVGSEAFCQTTAVIALIKKNKLYVANVGNCKAFLCKEDASGVKKAYQLTVDHEFTNEDEILRLSQLGISNEILSMASGNEEQKKYPNTRCIGNYYAKKEHKKSHFSDAVEPPIIAEPEVIGGIKLDDTCKFLFLMSNGLYRSLEEANDTEDTDQTITEMIIEYFSKHSTLNEITQAVVDEIVQLHQNAFINIEDPSKHKIREDITLMIRNFNMPLSSDICQTQKLPLEDEIHVGTVYTLEAKPFTDVDTAVSGVSSIANPGGADESDNYSKNDNSKNSHSKDTFSTSSGSIAPQRLFQSSNFVSLDDDGRIKPYVDFNEFYELVEEAFKEKLVPEDWRKQDES